MALINLRVILASGMNIAKSVYLFILYTILYGIASPAFSQRVTVNITPLSSSNSLPQHTIQAIFKDHYGFLWFGTEGGLNKYDGYQLELYKHSFSNHHTLPANYISAINEDKAGNLWVGTRTNGLSCYNRQKNWFTNFTSNACNPQTISNNDIKVIYRDKANHLWIGTSAGLNLYNDKNGKFIRISSTVEGAGSLGQLKVTAIYEDKFHRFWLGTPKGLVLMDRKTGKCSLFTDAYASENGGAYSIYDITEDDNHNLWLGSTQGLSRFDVANKTFTHVQVEPDRNSANGTNAVYCFAPAGRNQIWMGTNTTLQLLDATTQRLIPVSDKTDGDSPMPNDGIYTLLKDNAGILWIGTSSEGIVKYDKNLSLFPSYKASLTNNPSAQNIIRGLGEDQKENLYLATDDGVDYFNRSTNAYTHYKHSFKLSNSLLSNYTTALLVSKKTGLVWIGTYNSGLDCFNPKTNTFTHYIKGATAQNLNSNAIDALLEDRNGNIWVGTNGGGLDVIQPNSKLITRYANNPKDAGSLCDNVVDALYEDKQGRIWVGGYTNGISIFDPGTRKITQLNTHNSKLNSNVINAFCEDRQGNMWIGTMEGGLNCYEPATNTVKAYTDQNGLPSNTIQYLVEDKNGKLWVTTTIGVSMLNPEKKQFRNYNLNNGLKTLEYNLGSGIRLKNGEIAVGSINGLSIINPDKLPVNRKAPEVIITGLSMLNKPVGSGDKNIPLQHNTLNTTSIDIPYGQSVFTINFVELNYTAPDRNRYLYMLQGFDNEWRNAGNQRSATYTNLDPGTYVFKVKAANNDGFWTRKPTTLTIHIIPPFWMTWRFKTLIIILLFGAAYGYYLYKISIVQVQKAKLEKVVRKRTWKIARQAKHLEKLNNELQSQTEELQAQSEELKVATEELHAKTQTLQEVNGLLQKQKAEEQKARLMAEQAQQAADRANLAKSTFLATMSHEIRTPMNGVLGMAALLAETKLTREQQEYAEAILNSGEALLNVINDVLDFSKIESGNVELDPHNFELRKCIEDILELFAAKSARTGIDLIYHIDDNIPSYLMADSMRIRQVLINLVGNALKFTHKGEVYIGISGTSLSDNNWELQVEVRDTGIGIAENQMDNLFKPFNQLDSSITRKYGGTGLGLVICERLVKLMGGTIGVTSQLGIGTSFYFNLHCKKGIDPQPNTVSLQSNVCEGKKVLVVDDNETNLRILSVQLQKWHIMVTAVSSGSVALEILSRQNNIDLVITDMQMPDMDGITLTTEIKAIRKEIPVVLLSSIGDETKRRYAELFAAVLTKPVKHKNLYNVIAAELGKKEVPGPEQKTSILSADFAIECPMQILVAEDNLMNQKLIMRVLNKLGYQPDLANHGQEVLSKIKDKSYHLILMDIQMPHLDGLETTRILRKEYGGFPLILAMTANAMTEDKERCLDAGMNDYMSKPINLEALTHKLRDMYHVLQMVH